VVGLPKNMDGSLGPSAEAAQEFGRLLHDRLSIPVHLWDERLTSQAAERTLVSAGMRRRARRAVLDQVAATMILQGFLDRQRAMADRGDS
jgi:putative Holliday junction resolvase